MGISTVAVFSDADEGAPFVRSADRAVRIGPASSAESYLRIDKIVDAAKRTRANAIHPGFGFLAENAELAEACASAGITFVGPSPRAIRDMGLKREAKAIVAKAGVPVIPGGSAEDQTVQGLSAEARRIGFPILVTASAGGGGKGMRVVHDDAELEAAIEGAKREAKSSFGNDTLLIEKYIERPRHVEIQILGDAHGNLVHLFERECSIQRRHQKIIEETPSPALDAALRDEMGRAAVAVGKAVDYQSAGTVEFILGPDRKFYFLEVNTRLQVEHPITEAVTGIDIVREQLLVAQGHALSFRQEDLRMNGAAVECRLYAEDADNGFLPTTGKVVDFHFPEMPDLRVDTGVEAGTEIGIHYDPMIAKVITWAPSRPEAIQKMRGALSKLSLQGVVTNRAFLLRVLGHEEFASGNTHTHFIDEHLSSPETDAPDPTALGAIAVALEGRHARQSSRDVLPALSPGFRNNRFAPEWVELRRESGVQRVEYTPRPDGSLSVHVGELHSTLRNVSVEGPEVSFEDGDGVRHTWRVIRAGDHVYAHGVEGSVAFLELPRFPEPEIEVAPGACVAPMPGKVVKLAVAEGDAVEMGQVLVVLEAMKMEHSVKAPESGVVRQLLVSEGEQVEADAVLAVVSSEE